MAALDEPAKGTSVLATVDRMPMYAWSTIVDILPGERVAAYAVVSHPLPLSLSVAGYNALCDKVFTRSYPVNPELKQQIIAAIYTCCSCMMGFEHSGCKEAIMLLTSNLTWNAWTDHTAIEAIRTEFGQFVTDEWTKEQIWTIKRSKLADADGWSVTVEFTGKPMRMRR